MQTNADERDVIIMEHVLENDENLEMALDIISMTSEIRTRIIKNFLKEFKDFICKNLDMSQWDWETELYDKSYRGNSDRYFGVSYNNVSQEPVFIALSANPTANAPYIGVFTHNELFYHNMEHLKCKMDQEFESGFSGAMPWFWYQYLHNYTNWTRKDTLMKMYTETDCVVEDIGNRLLDIIEVAKPVIEEWARNLSPMLSSDSSGGIEQNQ